MKWYKRLYLGDNAKKEKYKIFGKVCKGRFQLNTYLIVLSDHPDHLLDIVSAGILKQPYYKKKAHTQNIYIVGLAKGYEEALEVVRTLIDDVYTDTGGFDIRAYLKFGQKSKR